MRLTARAIRMGWTTPEEDKPGIIAGLIRFTKTDEGHKPRVVIAAARVLIFADLKQQELDLQAAGNRGGTIAEFVEGAEERALELERERGAVDRGGSTDRNPGALP